MVDDNFFDFGGDCLIDVRLADVIRRVTTGFGDPLGQPRWRTSHIARLRSIGGSK